MAHDEAWEILNEYRDVLDDLVLELMEKETLGKDDLARIFAPVAKRPPHNTYAGFGRRAPSDKPPVMTPAELAAVGRAAVRQRVGRGAAVAGRPGAAGERHQRHRRPTAPRGTRPPAGSDGTQSGRQPESASPATASPATSATASPAGTAASRRPAR